MRLFCTVCRKKSQQSAFRPTDSAVSALFCQHQEANFRPATIANIRPTDQWEAPADALRYTSYVASDERPSEISDPRPRAGYVHVCADRSALADDIAEAIDAVAKDAIERRGIARIALAADPTLVAAYAELAPLELGARNIDWFSVEERVGAAGDGFSARLRKQLVEGCGVPADRLCLMPDAPGNASYAAHRYEAQLCARFGQHAAALESRDGAGRSVLQFDLVVAALGPDGSLASHVPGDTAFETTDLVAVTTDGHQQRICLGRPLLTAARRVLVAAWGAARRPAFEAARVDGSENEIPARLLLAAHPGAVTWVVDRATSHEPLTPKTSDQLGLWLRDSTPDA